MNKQYYLRINADDYDKIREFCKENNINLGMRSELFAYITETCIDGIVDNLELKSLFSKDENNDHDKDSVYYQIEDCIKSIIVDNFNKIEDIFYKRGE